MRNAAGRAVHCVADEGDGGEVVLPTVGRLRPAAGDEQEGPRGRDRQWRIDRRRRVLPTRTCDDRQTVDRIVSAGIDVVFNWESAVREAGTLDQDAVARALDHARLPDGPGGAAAMVPGQHHLRLNMYIAQVRKGALDVVKSLGPVDPKEQMVGALVGE